MSKRSTSRTQQETSETEITIGWQILLVPLVIAVIGLGYVVGRTLAGPSAAETAATGAGASVDTANQGQPVAQQPAPQQQAVPQQRAQPVQVEPQSQFPEGQVIDLPPSGHPMIGQQAPDFTLTLLETGEEVSLSDYLGQPVLVDFWATWCPPCRLEMPWLQAAYEKYEDAGFVILAVDAGERVPPSMVEDTVRQFVDQHGLTFPILLGDDPYGMQREWQVLGLPSAYLIDPKGVVVDVHRGMYPNQATLEHELEQTFAAQLGEAATEADGAPDG